MRVVLQRVSRAEVRVAGVATGIIGRGYLLLTGFHPADTTDILTWMADKVIALRLFPDDAGRMNHGLTDVAGDILVVSQFTLYGDASRGRRPGFTAAAPPDIAVPLYDEFIELLRTRAPGKLATGEFGAHMDVELVNDGPVTLILER